jgi:nicotinamidase-related amidase
MVAKNESLHGNVPDTATTALLLIDVINDLEFEGGDALLQYALPMAARLAALKRRAKQAGIPAIYANDNYGRWQSDFTQLIDHVRQEQVRGRPIADLLLPEADDYFVLKPKHSAFYSTTLETLLRYLKVQSLILSGIAGNSCVFFTASDAFMRDFHLYVPADCVASIDPRENDSALRQLQLVLQVDTTLSPDLDLEQLACRPAPPTERGNHQPPS